MMRALATLWLVIVILAGGCLGMRIVHGLHFSTDLMALLPQEEQDKARQHSNDIATQALARRVVFMVGNKDKAVARQAATDMTRQFVVSGLFDMTTDNFDKSQLQQLGALYYPYRAGLLSDNDRTLLKTGDGQTISSRALSQVYGVVGFANAKLLHGDPFLLLPSFLTSLPLPQSRLTLDDGMLSLQDNRMTWILVAGQLKGEPFALETQKQVTDIYKSAVATQHVAHPDVEVLHLGAVFFAKAGADQAMGETSTIGIASTVGTILLIIVMFRAVRPLLLSLLVIGVGILTALSASLLLFGELHVGALLFGISLIGVSVDYSLQYCSEVFAPQPGTSVQRLKRVLGGISLGTATTVIGYLTLYLAPFPGLHQIAAFSAVGLIASWLTVVLWLPLLDKSSTHIKHQPLTRFTTGFLNFWESTAYRKTRIILLVVALVVSTIGLTTFHSDDNVRHMQSLSGSLVGEQEKIQQLIGTTAGNQFFVVQAADDETALQKEEELAERLQPLVASGALTGFQSPAQYIPSAARQMKNRKLQQSQLYASLLKQQTNDLHLNNAPVTPDMTAAPLTIADAKKLARPPAFLSNLLLNDASGEVTHMVALDNVTDLDAVKNAAADLEGVRLIDPAGDFSRLLGKYRNRAVMLLALSALLMAPLLVGRYGLRKGLWVMMPPLLAVILSVALRSLAGAAFTFFDAMGLVLVLSIGIDYAVFCAETTQIRKTTTLLAVTMAAGTALLSFGLLALSQVAAVHNFGATMTLGILFSFLLAPLARVASKEHMKLSWRNLVGIALVLFLNACASAPADTTQQPLSSVQIAPNLRLTMPSPADLGRSVEASQLVTAHYGDQSFAFEARISATPQLFRLVGFDLMGRKLITINWTPDHISFEKASWVPDQLRAENILADIVLLYWPDATIRKSLIASNGTLTTHGKTRTISQNGAPVWQAIYPTKNKNKWVGNITYSNLAWGYNFDVQSAEVAP